MNKSIPENYSLAIKQFYDYSTGDPTATLAKEHGLIGLTRIITCMQHLGLDSSKVDFIALPDFTFTRSKLRWSAGFPYGCIIRFHNLDVPFIPVDFRPNCCGVIFAELPLFEDTALGLQKKYYEILSAYPDINSSDFNRRNHFMGIYQSEANKKYYFLLHGSFSFAKRALYSEKNELLALDLQIETILGEPFAYLIGTQATEYYTNYQEFEALTFYYRELITKTLFPDANILFHRTHEGFYGIGTILLGAYADSAPFSCPIMLAPECDLPIIQITTPIYIPGRPPLYCSPHGGGYALDAVSAAQRIDYSIEGNYILAYPNLSEMLTNNVLDMPFYYRTQTDKVWCDNYLKSTEQLRLKPILNLKV